MNPISIRVGSGSVASSDSKNILNRGSTNTASTTTVTIDDEQDDDRVGERGLDLAARFEVALDVARQLVEHVVEAAGQLGGPDHVDVELREERLEGRERGRERVAGDQRLRTSGQDLAERLVLGLLLDDLRARRRAGCRRARTPRAAARSASVRACLQLLLVISNCRTLFFSLSLRTSSPWSTSPPWPSCTEVGLRRRRAIRFPSVVVATYLNLVMARPQIV